MELDCNQHILLTGAGFTHNFGAPLAEGMWNKIFNNNIVQANPALKKLLANNLDFEAVYESVVQREEAGSAAKDAMRAVVETAYCEMDTTVRIRIADSANSPSQLESRDLKEELLQRFHPKNPTQYGFIFTLNQDLGIEYLAYRTNLGIDCPAIPGWHQRIGAVLEPNRDFKPVKDRSLSLFRVPDTASVDAAKRNFAPDNLWYVKLHGSHDWVDSGGKGLKVLGGMKPEQMAREPLLKWYWEIFKDVLFQKDRRLLVIGYGFRDTHVNRILAEGVKNAGLKIFILSPEAPKDLFPKIDAHPHGQGIRRGIAGYFQNCLADLFPVPNVPRGTEAWQTLERTFFA